jgi:DnaJ-domain-containing protein 1
VSMSWHEVLTIVIGLAGGYWIVSRVMEHDGQPFEPDASVPESQGGPRPEPKPAPTQPPKSWWQVLEVSPKASLDEIVVAYRKRISEYHPDKVAQMGEDIRAVAERKSKEINAAYEQALRSLGSGPTG